MNHNEKFSSAFRANSSEIIRKFEEKRSLGKESRYATLNKILYANESLPVASVVAKYKKEKIIFNRNYQRDYVWVHNRVKSELIKSIIFKLPIGALTYQKTDDGGLEVLDGQQRIRTIMAFMNVLGKDVEPKRFNLSDSVSQTILQHKYPEFKKDYETALIKKDLRRINRLLVIFDSYNKDEPFRLSWFDLPLSIQDSVEEYCFNAIVLNDNFTEEEIKEYFKVIQNQEKLKASQILKSHDKFKQIYNHISANDLELFCQLLNFNNSKNEVAKILANVILLDQLKTPLNAPDETILANFNALKEFKESQVNFLSKLKQIIFYYPKAAIEKIYDAKKTQNVFRRFSLKLLFLAELYSVHQTYLKQPLLVKEKIVSKINDYTKILNSKDIDTKQKEIPHFILHDITEIWRLSRTTHKKDKIIFIFTTHFEKVVNYLIINYPQLLNTTEIDDLLYEVKTINQTPSETIEGDSIIKK